MMANDIPLRSTSLLFKTKTRPFTWLNFHVRTIWHSPDNNLNFYDIRVQFSHNSQTFYEKCQNSDVYCFFWQTKSLLDTPAIQKRTQKNDKTLGKKPRQEHEWKKYLKFFMAINQTITSSLWFIGEGSCARRQTRIFREQCFFKPFICLTLILFGFCRFLDDKDQVWPLTQFFNLRAKRGGSLFEAGSEREENGGVTSVQKRCAR